MFVDFALEAGEGLGADEAMPVDEEGGGSDSKETKKSSESRTLSTL